jgi:hypothetical protein
MILFEKFAERTVIKSDRRDGEADAADLQC